MIKISQNNKKHSPHHHILHTMSLLAFFTLPSLQAQNEPIKSEPKIVYRKTVIDSFLDDIVERLALIQKENEDGFESFVFNQHYSLNTSLTTYFTIISNLNFDELYIRTNNKNEIITILSSNINKSIAGDFRHNENWFVIYPEQLDIIYRNNSDTKARIVYNDEIRGPVFIDFTIPLKFWQRVRRINLGESEAETNSQ